MERWGVGKTGLAVRRIWRSFLIVAKWTSGVLVVLGLLFFGINWFDEDLSPEAKALLIAPPNPYKPEENLYLALMGFDAKAGESPIAAGQAKVVAYEKEIAVILKDPQYALRIFPDAPWEKKEKLEFQGKVDFCLPLTKSCFAGVETRTAEIGHLLKANRELYRRYLGLHGLKGYYDTATPSVYLMSAYASFPVRQLHLANIALRTQSGTRLQRKVAIADLGDDIRTWRRVVTGSGSLVSKMIAVANMQGDYALLSDIIADGKLDLQESSPEIRSALELSEDDWKIGSCFVFEYRTDALMWDQTRVAMSKGLLADPDSEGKGWWERLSERFTSLFFKINATQNLDAKIKTHLRKIAEADPAEFFIAREAYRNWLRNNVGFATHYVYNPFGKILMNVASSIGYENYSLRAYDAAAFQRLVRLGYEIRSQKVEDRAIPSFIHQHPQWASHPVDGRPFVWDEKRREITVQTLGQQPKDRRFGISVWNAAPRK